MQRDRKRRMWSSLTMASSLAWMSILPATAVMAMTTPTVTPGSVHLSGPIRPTNGSVTFTASASDPNGTAEYQFWVESPNGQWTDMQNYSTNNTFALATPSQGDYLVVVDVLDQAQVAAGDWSQAQTTLPDGVFNGSTVSVASNASGSVSKGTLVTLTATSSGIFDPLYQFWYQEPNGTWHQSGPYQSSNQFTFTAGMSGTYKFVAFAKSPEAANNQHGALQSNVGTQVAYGTASQVVLTMASPTVVANGSATDMLTATVEDSHGDVVANFTGTVVVQVANPQGHGAFTFLDSSGKTADGTQVAVANGQGTVLTSALPIDGNYTYILRSDNLMSTNSGQGGVATQSQVANVTYGSATVMTTAPTDNMLMLQSNLPNLESNHVSSATVWVQLEDSTGAPYSTANGQYVNLTLGGTASGSFSAASSQTTASIQVPAGASQFPVTVYSEKGSNGTLTVQAQSGDPSQAPLVPGSISIPVYEVGTPAAVDVSQVGMTRGGYPVYQADVVDASGHTISLGPASSGTMSVLDNSATANPSAGLDYFTTSVDGTGFHLASSATDSPGLMSLSFSTGMADFSVATEEGGSGKPLTITATDLSAAPNVSGSFTWHFAAPTAGYVGQLPRYAGKELSHTTVTAGAITTSSFQLKDQYRNAVQEAGQPVWFTLQNSGMAALPNGASQAGDVYEAFTNAQGIASIPLRVLSNATADTFFQVSASGSVGGEPGHSYPEYSQRFNVVAPSDYATGVTLSAGSAMLNGATLTVPAGMPLSTITATLQNALGGLTSGNYYDELLFQSSNSGMVSVGRGDDRQASQLEYSTVYDGNATSGGVYAFGSGEFSSDGLYAGSAGTATITVTDVSNAAMPSASFTVRVVPGAPLPNAQLYYSGAPLSGGNNPGNLSSGTVTEMWVKNVDAGGDPIAVSGTTPLEVILPTVANGEWATSLGGFASPMAVVSILPGQSSAPVWFESTGSVTSSNIGDAMAMDAAQQLAIAPTSANAPGGSGPSSATYTVTADNLFGEALPAGNLVWASWDAASTSATASANGSALASATTQEAVGATSGQFTITVVDGTLPSSAQSGTVTVQDLPTSPDQVKTATFTN